MNTRSVFLLGGLLDTRHQPHAAKTLKNAFLLCLILPALSFGFGLDQENLSQGELTGPLNGPQDAAADTIQGPDDGTGNNRPAPDPGNPAGLCPDLIARDSSSPLTGDSAELLGRCTELVLSAHPGVIPGTEDFELGIGDDAIRDALQQVVPEESEIIGSGATDTSHDQLANVGSRLQFLRTGSSTLPIAGVYLGENMNGGMAAAEGYSRWGLFFNGSFGTGEKDETFNENGFEYDAYGFTLGVDYRFNENFVGGIALGIANSDVDIDRNAGDYDTEGESIAVYALYNAENYYVEGTVTFGSYDYEGVRRINYGTGAQRVLLNARSDTDGDQVAWSLAAGWSNSKGGTNHSVYGRFEGVSADIDGYDETGESSQNTEWLMRVNDQDIDSLQGILGFQIAHAASMQFGVLQPYLNLEFHYEFDDDSREVSAFYLADPGQGSVFPVRLTTDEPDQDFFLVSVGTSVVFKGGNQLFLTYERVLELDNVDSHGVTAGLRIEF